MIDDLALRWTVTALFVAGGAGYLYLLVARPGRWPYPVRHLLHLAMPIAMVAMAWPGGAALPTAGPIAFFLVAAVWFAAALVRHGGVVADRLTNGYHAVKMLAMVWMYVMMTAAVPGQVRHPAGHGGVPPSHAAVHPGWAAAVNTLAAVGFTVAALWWAGCYLAERRRDPKQPAVRACRVASLAQALMAAGAAIMFAALG